MISIKTNQEGNIDARNFVKLYNMIIPVGLVYHKITFNTTNNTVKHEYKLSSLNSSTSTPSSILPDTTLTTDRREPQELTSDSQMTYKAKNTDSIEDGKKLTTSIFRLTVCQVKTNAQIT